MSFRKSVLLVCVTLLDALKGGAEFGLVLTFKTGNVI